MGAPLRRGLAALLLLGAAAAAQDGEPEALARFRAKDWEGVIAATAAARERPAPDRGCQSLLRLRAEAEWNLGRIADAAATAEAFARTVEAGGAPDPGTDLTARMIHSHALFYLHRPREFAREWGEIRGAARGARDAGELDSFLDLASVDRPPEAPFTVRPYRGTWEKDPRMRSLIRDLPSEAAAALAIVFDRLGTADAAFPRVWLRIEDGLEDSPQAAMATALAFSGGEPTPLVRIDATPTLLLGPARRMVLAHELGHALSDARPQRRLLPPWIEEGLACWLSGESEEALGDALAREAQDPAWDAASALGGWQPDLEGRRGKGSLATQHAGDLAFRGMERRYGVSWVRRFVGACLAREDLRAFLEREVHGGVAEWQAACRREVRTGLARATAGRGEFLAARALMGEKRWRDAAAAWESFLREGPEGAMRRAAVLERAGCLLGSGEPKKARAAAEEWLRENPAATYPYGARLIQIEAAAALGDRAAVEDLGPAFLADYGGLLPDYEKRVRGAMARVAR